MKLILSVLIVFGMMLSLTARSGLPAPADPADAPARLNIQTFFIDRNSFKGIILM